LSGGVKRNGQAPALVTQLSFEVGTLAWVRDQRPYDMNAAPHLQGCAADRLKCPQKMFAQLFHEDAGSWFVPPVILDAATPIIATLESR
jgi:hypothetical protein